ncbi:hypothetical protein MMC26_007002 [Xylographa opegraphella]|nr:hypothetical protein [Xylographa opegraphella]
MSFLPSLNPTPAFPKHYGGPYPVGTVDIEIPVSELPSVAPTPDSSITTVSFRVFYPCESPHSSPKPVYWIPDPQHGYVSAYARFLGASSKLSQVIAYFPRLLYHITIPAVRNAKVLAAPTESKRWPVVVFSHGLGGSRNAYSHLLGSLSSYGIVAIAPEHREGSAPISYIKQGNGAEPVHVDYRSIPHTPSREVEEARDEQLKIRLWELGLVHEALLMIDKGAKLSNIASEASSKKTEVQNELLTFGALLDVHRPGSISWAGHSFGAATVYQFVKSVFYCPSDPGLQNSGAYHPLYVPADDSSIRSQITPQSTVALLDLWTLPLRSAATTWLWRKPLPCYESSGGANVLVILSEAFFKWRGNLISTKQAVSADPSGDRRHDPAKSRPHIFYPFKTAHVSQSDFGILFPWATKKFMKAEEPERTLKLNVLAILELMRQNGKDIASLSEADRHAVLEQVQGTANGHAISNVMHQKHGHANGSLHQSKQASPAEIDMLSPQSSIRGWVPVSVDVEDKPGEATNEKTGSDADPSEAVMESEVMNSNEDHENESHHTPE